MRNIITEKEVFDKYKQEFEDIEDISDFDSLIEFCKRNGIEFHNIRKSIYKLYKEKNLKEFYKIELREEERRRFNEFDYIRRSKVPVECPICKSSLIIDKKNRLVCENFHIWRYCEGCKRWVSNKYIESKYENDKESIVCIICSFVYETI